MKNLIATLIFLFTLLPQHTGAQIILPTPEETIQQQGKLQLSGKRINCYSEDTQALWLPLLTQTLFPNTTVKLTARKKEADILFIKDSKCTAEAYRLEITPKHIQVRSNGHAGFVYAIQTLRQCKIHDEETTHTFMCTKIQDQPRTAWRSFLLDSGRQYQSTESIKKYIDMASMLKMNVFHWHLTEGLGWRIEIKRYPKLTQTGAFVGKGKEQQGYYTQEEITRLVQYAQERNITIVPEIDMPGHAEAALNAHPELGCFGIPAEIPQLGFTQNIFCAGKDSTIQFLKNVLDKVCELFPSTYIHLGGDEAPKGNWDKCPDCQQKINTLGIKNSHNLQLWFAEQMALHLKNKGRKAIFWGDVVYQDEYPLPNNVIIQWWNYRRHKDLALRKALKHQHPVVCTPNYYTYLNFPVTPWRGYGKERTFDLYDVYTNNPAYKATQMPNPLVLGMGCALWTDDELTEDMLDQRLFPRILALAEQMWHCGTLKDFPTFLERVNQKKNWIEQQGYTFGPGLNPYRTRTEKPTDAEAK